MTKVGRPALNKETITKSIKLDLEESEIWNSKKVHAFLQGKEGNSNELKIVLRVYHTLFNNLISKHFNMISENAPELLEYINSHDEFNKIGDLL
ncbi:MAG: hypothetical protein ACTSP9_07985 [Promethearchaeota archaeon]